MKSAWMLNTTIALLFALIGGCMQPGWQFATPPQAAPQAAVPREPAAAQPAQNDQQAASNVNPPATMPAAVAESGSADESAGDAQVAELAQRIEALAQSTAQVQNSTLVQNPAAPGPAATQAPPANPQAHAQPVQATATVTPPTQQPAQVPLAVSPPVSEAAAPIAVPIAPATQPAAAQPAFANAPTPSIAPREVNSEAVASPTPRSVPTIQPTPVAPAPAPAPALPSVTVEITDIRPVASPTAASPSEVVAASANQPSTPEQPAPAASLEDIIAGLEKSLAQQPPRPQDELRLRLLYLAAEMDEKSAQPVKGMDPIQAEVLNAIVKAVASSKQAMLEPLNAAPDALAAADELRRLMGQQSGVSIPRVALVTKVNSYGDYELISPARFKAGSEIHAYVYTEVANFRCEPVDGDRLRTLLSQTVQVFDSNGKTVWERHEANIEDRVRTPRRDFFIPFPMRLPATLVPGEYVVKVTIEDRIGNTTDQQRLSFSIQ